VKRVRRIGYIVLAVAVLSAVFVFFYKETALKKYITGFVENEFGGKCRVEAAKISGAGAALVNLSFIDEDIEVILSRFSVNFNIFPPAISAVGIDGAKITVKNPARLKRRLAAKFTNSAKVNTGFNIFPLPLELKNIQIKYTGTEAEFAAALFLKCLVDDKRIIGISAARIDYFNFSSRDLIINRLSLLPCGGGLYSLKIDGAKIGKRSIEGLTVPLKIEGSNIILVDAQNIFFGPRAEIFGAIIFSGYRDIAVGLNLKDMSLDSVVGILVDKGDFRADGLFDAGLNLFIADGKISSLGAVFSNIGGGFIDIKKDDSLGFLRRGLNETQYNTLIDGFKNYAYNSGIIKITMVNDEMVTRIVFDSFAQGRRDIDVPVHRAGGD
jgi:hypothetical protein